MHRGLALRAACPLYRHVVYATTFPELPMEHSIKREDEGTKGAFFVQMEGQRVAEMTYSRTNATLIIIDHTEVDAALSGLGIGRKLLVELVAWARSTGIKVVPLCPFAKALFVKDASIRDVLA
jgi:predicted GNAT family acetyltransferase